MRTIGACKECGQRKELVSRGRCDACRQSSQPSAPRVIGSTKLLGNLVRIKSIVEKSTGVEGLPCDAAEEFIQIVDKWIRQALAGEMQPSIKEVPAVTDEELLAYNETHDTLLKSATNLQKQSVTGEDAVLALIGMNHPEEMARAAIRYLSAEPSGVVESPLTTESEEKVPS